MIITVLSENTSMSPEIKSEHVMSILRTLHGRRGFQHPEKNYGTNDQQNISRKQDRTNLNMREIN